MEVAIERALHGQREHRCPGGVSTGETNSRKREENAADGISRERWKQQEWLFLQSFSLVMESLLYLLSKRAQHALPTFGSSRAVTSQQETNRSVQVSLWLLAFFVFYVLLSKRRTRTEGNRQFSLFSALLGVTISFWDTYTLRTILGIFREVVAAKRKKRGEEEAPPKS